LISTKLLSDINNVFWDDNSIFKTEVSDNDPLILMIQIAMSYECYRGNCKKLSKINKRQFEQRLDFWEFVDDIENELYNLEKIIHRKTKLLNWNKKLKYTRNDRAIVVRSLIRLRLEVH